MLCYVMIDFTTLQVLSVVQNPGDCGAMDCLLSGKALWRSKLSVALCPHGCAPEVSLTQEQLYARYDLMTALGISDTYLFLWNLIVPHKGVVAPDGEYWLNAMARFRSH